ncbi:MAG: 50S ribosomal protein L15 [Dehalococcoidales bacterium]|nr:50S ribosomal protein L15 [Dehalococcoidales bacterium]MDD3264481.1 50S ribosomal protein L15 [Dehalococcoidales bacterium]MDD4322012.1 50S ribosomal protein L15 [Dehalococcoidales bacterium]MDD4793895.1 50S ribosomal protein L15 [Dehalococcoidales bacterium]MDD5122075.1 50S ribosomal protein L15 [Dehalococcoidales bacterium]
MNLNELAPAPGSKRDRKRVGRGNGSGHGTYSCRGMKGQKARAGCKIRPGFEGGQLPIIKRLPRKRGFTNIFKTEFSLVNVEELIVFEAGSEVSLEKLLEYGLVKTLAKPVKILARGDLDRPLKISANNYSDAAKAKIEAAGGSIEEVPFGSGAVQA